MSAIKTSTMRHQEDFPLPLDLISLNLEDYTFDEGQTEIPLELEVSCESYSHLNWLPVDPANTNNAFSPTPPSYHNNVDISEQFQSVDMKFLPEETNLNIKDYVVTSPPSTPGCSTPGKSSTSGFTPTASPMSSYPSSPKACSPTTTTTIGPHCVNPPGAQVKVAPSTGKARERAMIPRHKRKSHIDAEQRRRSKIQNAFDTLKLIVPSLAEGKAKPGKDSKSGTLSKTVDYCCQLRSENKELKRETDRLRQEMRSLSDEITLYQNQLPAAGIDVTNVDMAEMPPREAEKEVTTESMFEDYLRARTLTNWKFWIFGLVIRPLFEKYNKSVVTTSVEAFKKSVKTWAQNHLSLVALRPVLLNTLRFMSRNTSIMSNPERIPEEAMTAAIQSTIEDTSSIGRCQRLDAYDADMPSTTS